MYTIVRHEALTPSTFSWELDAPDIARAARPGQFVMVRVHEGSERIPLTIADYDAERGTITLVVQVLGKSTHEMADRYRTGDAIADVVGPLGRVLPIAPVGHVAFVGGGLGVAPVFPVLRAAKEAGNRTTAILGFRRADLVFWEERLRRWADHLVVCTDDGSYGRPGLVTGALAEVVATDRPDQVVAIGPLAMMQACADTTAVPEVPTIVSINTIMVDGTGMCGSCRVNVGGQVRFACVDGPDFDAHQVDFDELLARQRRFRQQEDQAARDYEHLCSLEHELFADGRYVRRLKDLDPHQVPMPQRDPAVRVRGFDEVNLGYSLTEALHEAERCIQCARPTCISGCPVAVDIPRFIRHLMVRDVDGALGVIHESNVLPSVCGRVCPQESQCESQCVIGRKLEPVAIGRLERFVGDHGRIAHPPRPEGPSLGRVAIAGSGPAGLACAADLARAGAQVTVFEALHVVGGVLRYGIPAFRLPREIIDREVAGLVELGVELQTDKLVGATFTVEQLLGEQGFDAVFLGVGAGAPAFLGIPGELAGQVYSANELLTRVNLMGGDRFPEHDTPVALGSRVVVIGGGNTAMDCLRVARRLGVPSVRCVYRRSRSEAPARVEELRHAEEEGVEFLWLHSPTRILVNDAGDVRGLELQKMALGEPDERGRRSPVPLDEVVTLACDTVVYALGTKANPIVGRNTQGLELDERGHVVADPLTQATSVPGVFAGGDIVTGGATVILAMGAGRRAARAITTYLRDGKPWPVPAGDLDAEAAPGRGRAASPGQATCPSCGRPVAGEEAYRCCAGASLQWRCEACGKVSEGFAFPYGACPACGGALLLLERGPLEEQPALDAIRAAFEIELGGRAFYRRAAAEATDPALQELFARFAAMEDEHMATLASRYHVAPPPEASDHAVDRAAVYAGVDRHPEDPANLFRIAIAFEQRAVRFFEERVGQAAGQEKTLYEELAAEEREHVDLLRTEYEQWRAGRAGLLGAGPPGHP